MPRPPACARLACALLACILPTLAHAQPSRPRHAPTSHAPKLHVPAKPAAPTPPPQPQATAPEPPPPLSPAEAAVARCRALLAQGIVTAGPATAEALDDGCRYTAVRFGVSQRFGYEAATLVEHGFPSEAPDKPVSVQVEARGIVFAPSSGNAKTDWLIRQQQAPFDVTLDASYDPAAKEFILRSLSLDSPALGHTELAMDVAGADGSNFPDDVALRSLHLHMDSRLLLLQFALGAAVAALPDGGDPATEMDRAKAQATPLARQYLPLTGASPATVDAIAAFVDDFPRPRHVLDLAVTASPPFKLRSVGDTDDKGALAETVMRTLAVTATYTGDPR